MIRFSSSCFSWLKRFMSPSGGCQSDLSPDDDEEKEHSNKRGGGCQSDLSPDEEEEEEHSNERGGGCQSDPSPDEEEKEEEHSNKRGGGCQSDLSSEEEEEDKFMEPSSKIVINISSDEEEEEEHSSKRGGGCQSDLKQQIKEELDDDCVILDGDPNKPLGVVWNESGSGSESDELVIVAEKGQVS